MIVYRFRGLDCHGGKQLGAYNYQLINKRHMVRKPRQQTGTVVRCTVALEVALCAMRHALCAMQHALCDIYKHLEN